MMKAVLFLDDFGYCGDLWKLLEMIRDDGQRSGRR
jgi:hypothetical protein